HGGYFPINHQYNLNIGSSSRVDARHELFYAEDLDENRIVYVWIDGTGDQAWYAITPEFVKKYMSFADNAFVFLDACHSAENYTMRNACFDKGASVYAGWKGGIHDEFAYRAHMFLLDRLLAANQYVPESPKQRSFDFGA